MIKKRIQRLIYKIKKHLKNKPILRKALIAAALALHLFTVFLLIRGYTAMVFGGREKTGETSAAATSLEPTDPNSYEIKGMTFVSQGTTELWAGCETFACKSALAHYGVDFDEEDFAENYLIKKPVSYSYETFDRYAPDLRSAFAGDIKEGYGIYSPAMETSINSYLTAKGIKLRAKRLEGVSLEELCRRYVLNDDPVMIWGNAYMNEPDEFVTWIVDYADENATHKIGETFEWPKNEHCLCLIGFDENDYIFTDSVAGEIGHYLKTDSDKCYEEMGMQAIVFEKTE